MIDPLATWLSEFEKIPQDTTGDQAPKNMANFINERVTGKIDLSNSVAKFSPPPSFTWQKSTFESLFRIVSKTPSPDPITSAIKIATAWQSATLTSTMVITAGATINPPPPGTNGIAGTAIAILDPASLSLAYAGLISDLSGSKPSAARAQSKLAKAIYTAFTKLTFTITGVDTKPPPTGPIPILLPLTPVV